MDSFEVKAILKKELEDSLSANATMPTGLIVVNSLTEQEAQFPRVVFQELNINTKQSTIDYKEYAKNLLYQVDIFCKGSAAEPMCRRIAKAVNDYLEKDAHLQLRGSGNFVQLDGTTKRYTMTYAGIFSELCGKIV